MKNDKLKQQVAALEIGGTLVVHDCETGQKLKEIGKALGYTMSSRLKRLCRQDTYIVTRVK